MEASPSPERSRAIVEQAIAESHREVAAAFGVTPDRVNLITGTTVETPDWHPERRTTLVTDGTVKGFGRRKRVERPSYVVRIAGIEDLTDGSHRAEVTGIWLDLGCDTRTVLRHPRLAGLLRSD